MYDNEVDKFAKAGKSMSVWLWQGGIVRTIWLYPDLPFEPDYVQVTVLVFPFARFRGKFAAQPFEMQSRPRSLQAMTTIV
jgi:hypothetical protein